MSKTTQQLRQELFDASFTKQIEALIKDVPEEHREVFKSIWRGLYSGKLSSAEVTEQLNSFAEKHNVNVPKYGG